MADQQYVEQIVREHPDIEAYKVGLLEAARQQVEQPISLPAYQAAGLDPLQLEAMSLARQGIGAYAPFLQAGTTGVGEGMSAAQQAALAAAGGQDISGGIGAIERAQGMIGATPKAFDPSTMVSPYMNPYQQQVIDESIRQIQRQGDIARQGLAAQAVRTGAFGGTREGVQRAELDRALAEQQNAAIVGALQQGYGQAQQSAMQGFEQAQQRGLAGTQLLGQLGASQAGLGLQQAGTLGQLGTQLGTLGVQQAGIGQLASQLGLQDVNALAALGSMGQQQAQNELEAARATALQTATSPYQRLGFLSDIYKGAPSSQIALTSSTAPSTSPLLQAVGLGVSGLSAAAGAQKAGLFG